MQCFDANGNTVPTPDGSTYLWSLQQASPPCASLDNPNAANPIVTGLTPGFLTVQVEFTPPGQGKFTASQGLQITNTGGAPVARIGITFTPA